MQEDKIGVTLRYCFCCGKDLDIMIFQKKKSYKGEVPRKLTDGTLCESCAGVVKQNGLLIVSVRDGEGKAHPENPYRTGNIRGITEEAKHRIFGDDYNETFTYMEDKSFNQLFNITNDTNE